MMDTREQQCVGYIQVMYADTAANQIITLGGAGFAGGGSRVFGRRVGGSLR